MKPKIGKTEGIGRLSGDLWEPWIKGGGTLGSDPDLAAMANGLASTLRSWFKATFCCNSANDSGNGS